METTTLKQLYDFAKNNGYLVAAYKSINGLYKLLTYDIGVYETIPSDSIIKTRPMLGSYIDYTVSNCNDYAFVLHNTYNLPQTQDINCLLV